MVVEKAFRSREVFSELSQLSNREKINVVKKYDGVEKTTAGNDDGDNVNVE